MEELAKAFTQEEDLLLRLNDILENRINLRLQVRLAVCPFVLTGSIIEDFVIIVVVIILLQLENLVCSTTSHPSCVLGV